MCYEIYLRDYAWKLRQCGSIYNFWTIGSAVMCRASDYMRCGGMRRCAAGLQKLGMQVFTGPHQGGTVSFVPGMDCETAAQMLGRKGIAVRAGLHCAPLAHESAGTLETGTIRVSFGHDADDYQTREFLLAASKLLSADL